MRKSRLLRPNYIDSFQCIAGSCEDSCCTGWSVPIDQNTWQKYQKIPAGPLRVLIDQHVVQNPEAEPAQFASIHLLPSKSCPMHNADKLCQIQVELGESYLSQTCSTFPRRSFTIDRLKETTLSLSCPEAARIVLTSKDLSHEGRAEPLYLTWNDAPAKPPSPLAYFWPIREFAIELIRNRDYELWQRLFLLGSFSRRLESLFNENGDYSRMEQGFTHAISVGSLRNSIETIPANNPLQLYMVTELAKLRSASGDLPTRLIEVLDDFMAGIGRDKSFEEQCTAYALAYKNFYSPFFRQNPGVLENLIINTVFRRAFPFGEEMFSGRKIPIEPARQYALLVTEFALIKGLLIGVAGSRKDAFAIDDVVKTVQVVTKHFEHTPEFVPASLALLASKSLDNAQGLTMLLRN